MLPGVLPRFDDKAGLGRCASAKEGLLAILVGSSSDSAEATGRAVITRTVTIPGGAFVPTDDDTGYQNDGDQMVVVGPSTSGEFIAPLSFEAQEVKIKKMVLYAYDNGAGSACASIYRTTPATGGDQEMGQVCSTGGTNGVRAFSQTSFDIRWMKALYGPYVHLHLPGTYGNGYSFHALRITYTYSQ